MDKDTRAHTPKYWGQMLFILKRELLSGQHQLINNVDYSQQSQRACLKALEMYVVQVSNALAE